jgi:hypothetical protein
MELVFIFVPIFGYLIARLVLVQRAAARAANLRLLEEALRNPALDRATIETLAHQLTGRRPVRNGGPSPLSTLVLAIGWIALFVGVSLVVIGGVFDDDGLAMGGIVTAISGFGLVTWPFALRELETRRQPQ